jgi:hypothetical protein
MIAITGEVAKILRIWRTNDTRVLGYAHCIANNTAGKVGMAGTLCGLPPEVFANQRPPPHQNFRLRRRIVGVSLFMQHSHVHPRTLPH